MTTLYIVERVSIYRHGVVVVSETEAAARRAIESYLASDAANHAPMGWCDNDGHHAFELWRLTAGQDPVLVATYRASGRDTPYRWVEEPQCDGCAR